MQRVAEGRIFKRAGGIRLPHRSHLRCFTRRRLNLLGRSIRPSVTSSERRRNASATTFARSAKSPCGSSSGEYSSSQFLDCRLDRFIASTSTFATRILEELPTLITFVRLTVGTLGLPRGLRCADNWQTKNLTIARQVSGHYFDAVFC